MQQAHASRWEGPAPDTIEDPEDSANGLNIKKFNNKNDKIHERSHTVRLPKSGTALQGGHGEQQKEKDIGNAMRSFPKEATSTTASTKDKRNKKNKNHNLASSPNSIPSHRVHLKKTSIRDRGTAREHSELGQGKILEAPSCPHANRISQKESTQTRHHKKQHVVNPFEVPRQGVPMQKRLPT